jgi:hypothetical protein
MAVLRTKCISTKVTDEEYTTLERFAGAQTMSEWMRAVLLQATTAPVERVLLAELLALRTIVLNLHFCLCRGEPITSHTMQQLIAQADQQKVTQADARLKAVAGRHV